MCGRGSGKPHDSLPDCSAAVTDAIGPDLDEWFDKHGRGEVQSIHLLTSCRGRKSVPGRHGQPMRRQGTLDEGES